MALKPNYHDPQLEDGRAVLVDALRQGRVAVLPTETVPGLAVLAGDERARRALVELKGSDPDRPFSLHLRDLAEFKRLLPTPPPGLARWLSRRLPGPFTIVLPKNWLALPRDWEWPWDTVGIRVPDQAAFSAVAAELPGPLLMTSVNPAGTPPLRGAELEAWLDAHDTVVRGVDAHQVEVGEPSPVVRFDPMPSVLRGRLRPTDLALGMRLLVVCTGNICRSPLGAALLERELASAWGVPPQDLQELGWSVASAGTYAMTGAPASENSVLAALEEGLDIRSHQAQMLDEALEQGWDLVLGMSMRHLGELPSSQAGELFDSTPAEVADPFGGDLPIYRHVRTQLQAAVEERVAQWSQWP